MGLQVYPPPPTPVAPAPGSSSVPVSLPPDTVLNVAPVKVLLGPEDPPLPVAIAGGVLEGVNQPVSVQAPPGALHVTVDALPATPAAQAPATTPVVAVVAPDPTPLLAEALRSEYARTVLAAAALQAAGQGFVPLEVPAFLAGIGG